MTERPCVMCGRRPRLQGQPQCLECRRATVALYRYWWDHGQRLSAHQSTRPTRHATLLLEELRREAA
jgi:hypothetical protein